MISPNIIIAQWGLFMKEKIVNFIYIMISFTILLIIFKNNSNIKEITFDSISLFINKVFSSLFPMFIMQDVLIDLNVPYYFYIIFNKPFNKLFKISGTLSYIFIMSLISGTPTNSYIIKKLYDDGYISSEEASHSLYFCYFSNPLFLLMMLNSIFNLKVAIKIIIIHYFSNIIIAFLVRKKAPSIKINKLTIHKSNITMTIINSIKNSINTLFIILGTIPFFMLLSYIILKILPSNPIIDSIIKGFLEVTNGLNSLNSLNINCKVKEILAISMISFGGLSIHTQIKTILEDSKISIINFYKGRIYQVIISIILVITI